MIANGNLLPDGLDALESACVDARISLMPLVCATCKWVDPETFRRLPVWYPEYHRRAPIYDASYTRQYTNTRKTTGEVLNKTEPNIHASKAIRQAMGLPVGWRGYNWTVCHIWGIDDPAFRQSNIIIQDPRYYSCVANMVLLPTPLKALTDSAPEIKHMLRVCAYRIYGWIPEVTGIPVLTNALSSCGRARFFPITPQPGRDKKATLCPLESCPMGP